MIVMKFGGTSVGDAEGIGRVARIVAGQRERSPLVVVSASRGITDHLLEAARAAEARDEVRMRASLDWIGEHQERLVRELQLPREQAPAAVETLETCLARLRDLTRGVFLLGECTSRSLDAVAAIGELLSHQIVTLALEAHGVPASAVDPRLVLRTDDRFGEATADREETARLCNSEIAPHLHAGRVPVTGGFVGADGAGVTTTLGRGGSDLSATLLGAAMEAEEIQIWTDVDGMMTADPRFVPEARVLRRVTFQEASELAFFGARVLHPATIRPAVDLGIPVRILNSFRPDCEGTVVRENGDDSLPDSGTVRAIAWRNGVNTLAVTSSRMLGAHGWLARVFEVFERHRTPVDVVTTSEVSVSMTVDGYVHLEQIRRDLESFCRTVRVEKGKCLVCIVGHRLLEDPALVGEILATLDGLTLRMFCLGSTDINLTFVLDESDVEEAVRRLHARFLEDDA